MCPAMGYKSYICRSSCCSYNVCLSLVCNANTIQRICQHSLSTARTQRTATQNQSKLNARIKTALLIWRESVHAERHFKQVVAVVVVAPGHEAQMLRIATQYIYTCITHICMCSVYSGAMCVSTHGHTGEFAENVAFGQAYLQWMIDRNVRPGPGA